MENLCFVQSFRLGNLYYNIIINYESILCAEVREAPCFAPE